MNPGLFVEHLLVHLLLPFTAPLVYLRYGKNGLWNLSVLGIDFFSIGQAGLGLTVLFTILAMALEPQVWEEVSATEISVFLGLHALRCVLVAFKYSLRSQEYHRALSEVSSVLSPSSDAWWHSKILTPPAGQSPWYFQAIH
jgi:hypothetical protein